MSATIKLITILPATLKVAWLLLLLGMVGLATGFFTQTPWQSHSGLFCLIFGYVIAILDMVYRKRHRGDAASFYVGAALTLLISVYILAFVALLFAITLAIYSLIFGFSGSSAMRLLHFMGIIFAFLVVSGIPRIALKAKPKNQLEQPCASNVG
jgi:hypothetical protein